MPDSTDDKTPAHKMRIKDGASVAILHAPDGLTEKLGLPATIRTDVVPRDADVIIEFAGTQADVEERLPTALRLMSPATALWIVYPKGSKAAGLDISRDTIWPLAERLGMRPVGMVSIDGTWSAFRLKKPA